MSYTKTNWENLPSTNTPLNATNLNKIETELEDLDNNKFIRRNIATAIDANDYRGSSMNGVYAISINSENKNLPNNLKGGTLTVMFGTNWGYQEFRTYNKNVQEIYTRNYFYTDASTPSWGNWTKLEPITVANTYSTAEHKIGYWKDGKPIYERTIVITSSLTVGINTFAHNIANVSKIISHEVNASSNYVLPYFSSAGKITAISQITATDIKILAQEGWGSNYEWDVTIRYTKTTD